MKKPRFGFEYLQHLSWATMSMIVRTNWVEGSICVKSAVKAHYTKWLARYRWRWIGVLTFRPGLKSKAARRALDGWMNEIERRERHGISWVAFPERGKDSGAFHFHVLIAGIGSRIYRYVKSWNRGAGHCALLVYDPHHRGNAGEGGVGEHRGVAYALKSLVSDDYELHGQLLDTHLLVRHRRALAKSAISKGSACPDLRASPMSSGFANRMTDAND